jgi:hypothetical protein
MVEETKAMTYMRLAAILIAAGLPATFPTLSSAGASCSEWRGECRNYAFEKKLPINVCDDSWKKCMKTGIWIGPHTGTNYGSVDKR